MLAHYGGNLLQCKSDVTIRLYIRVHCIITLKSIKDYILPISLCLHRGPDKPSAVQTCCFSSGILHARSKNGVKNKSSLLITVVSLCHSFFLLRLNILLESGLSYGTLTLLLGERWRWGQALIEMIPSLFEVVVVVVVVVILGAS